MTETSAVPAETVHSVYTGRLRDRLESLATWRGRDRRLANLRLATFFVGAAVAAISLFTQFISLTFAVPFVVAFVLLVIRHDRVIRECERLERAVEFYKSGLARLEDRWQGKGKSGQRFRDPAHPYAEDLDIFGRSSLFELLCTARTGGGEECLAEWLTRPATADAARRRQGSVGELKDRLDLREELDLLAVVTQKRVEPGFLVRWAAAPAMSVPSLPRILSVPFAASTVAGIAVWLTTGNPAVLFGSIAIGQIIISPTRRRYGLVMKGLGMAALELGFLEPILAHLEKDSYQSEELVAIRTRIGGWTGASAVRAIRELQTLDGYGQMRAHILTRALMELLLLEPHIAAGVARWKANYGREIAGWIRAVGEFEALSALATFAYENPDDVFPTLSSEGPMFDAAGLAHPLLHRATAVRNDITLDATRRLYIVSGSNMSGKSTLLRAVGINTVLALAGAPVRARSLTVSGLQIGASIRTQDSLEEGVSRFYAEIRRLHAIVELAGKETPVLFLLDEILHGTNSHDRRIGAEAVARALLARGAIGLLTTHDLALASIVQDAGANALNVHLQDELRDGKMSFDYQLRPGVVEKSNALELMRAVGLDV